MSLLIRRMTAEDVPAVARLDQMSFSLPWPEHSFRYEVSENRAARCLVAEDSDRRIIGMAVSWLILDDYHIATLAVHPELRRQGIGAQILSAALRLGSAEGARRALLEVRERNAAAQAMYLKFGFVVSGRRPHYYRDNGEDAILMTLEPLEAV